MSYASLFYRVTRKLTPPGIDWHSMLFFTLDLKQRPPARSSDKPSESLEYHIIESQDDKWLGNLCAAYPHKQFRSRMTADCQQCYIAVRDGQPIAYAWVTMASCFVSEINFHLPVGPGCVYIYDCFVRADCRGRGIYSALLMKIVADYRIQHWPHRYDTAYMSVEPGNTASIRGIRRAGLQEIAKVNYLRIGTFKRWYGVRGLIERMDAANASGTRHSLSD